MRRNDTIRSRRRRNDTIDQWPADARYPESHLREGLKQIHLAKKQLDDDSLVESLENAIEQVEEVHSQISYTDDE